MGNRNEEYDEFLNSLYGEVKLGYLVFDPADILYKLDPIVYRTGLYEWECRRDEEGSE